MSAIGPKQTSLVHRTCPLSGVKQTFLVEIPLSRSLLGAKRTWAIGLQMSAYDPKRHSRADHMLSHSVRSQCLFTNAESTPAHFPEFNFEPCGFLEDRNQLGLAGGRKG